MFNAYSYQGGTATLDPQTCGTNGQARTAEPTQAFNPALGAATYAGIPVGQPNPAAYAFQNFVPGQMPFSNGIPTAYGIPTGIPAYQPTPFGYAPTPVNPWVQPGFGAYVNPYATMNPYNTFNPFINQTPNPFVGYPQTTPYNYAVNPYTGIPTQYPTNFVPTYGNVAHPFFGATPTPFSPTPFVNPMTPFVNPASAFVNPMTPFMNPIPQFRPGVTTPNFGAWVNPMTSPFGTIHPIQQPGFGTPFFSNPVNFPGLTSPFTANVNPLVSGPSPVMPFGIVPFVNPLFANNPVGASIDPFTCSTILNQSMHNPIWGGWNPATPFINNLNPSLWSRFSPSPFGVSPLGGIPSLVSNPFVNTTPWNHLTTSIPTFGATPWNNWNPTNWNPTNGFSPIPTTPFVNNLSGWNPAFGLNPISNVGGFGAGFPGSNYNPLGVVNSCSPTCCI